MYPLHSTWLVEQQLERTYDPDRLDRVPVWARPQPSDTPGLGSRTISLLSHLLSPVRDHVRRATLGPVPNRCMGDPAGPRW